MTYACPYHNPTTMGHSNHNLDIRKALTHMILYMLPSALYSENRDLSMNRLGKEVLTNTDLDRFVNNIWEK